MWEIRNLTPFSSLGYPTRDRDGFEYWVVAVRASFDISDNGPVGISEQQDPINVASVYADDDATELFAESDFVPFRPNVDITFSGKVFAKDEAPFRELPFSIQVGNSVKKATAFGHRTLRKTLAATGWTVDENQTTTSVPLSWKVALGGTDISGGDGSHPYNPIGTGWYSGQKHIRKEATISLPQIENTAQSLTPSMLRKPIGFGAILPGWRPRRDYIGTYDTEWEQHRAPLLPSDFSEMFYHAAPADQIHDLRGGEPVRLVNLHPEGEYSFNLPQLILQASTRIGRSNEIHRLRLIGVHVQADRKRLSMLWNGAIRCDGVDDQIEKSIVHIKQMAGVRIK